MALGCFGVGLLTNKRRPTSTSITHTVELHTIRVANVCKQSSGCCAFIMPLYLRPCRTEAGLLPSEKDADLAGITGITGALPLSLTAVTIW